MYHERSQQHYWFEGYNCIDIYPHLTYPDKYMETIGRETWYIITSSLTAFGFPSFTNQKEHRSHFGRLWFNGLRHQELDWGIHGFNLEYIPIKKNIIPVKSRVFLFGHDQTSPDET